MRINHAEPAYTDNAASLVEDWGGKLGGLEYIRKNVPELADSVLPVDIILPGVPVPDRYSKRFQQSDPASIVRGSHRTDFQGMVDVFDTHSLPAGYRRVQAVGGFWPEQTHRYSSVAEIVEHIRTQAKSAEVMQYGRYENPTYDGEVVIGVSPKMKGIRGSILDHPNRPGVYVVSWVDESNPINVDISTWMFNEDGKRLMPLYPGSTDRIDYVKTLIELHKKIKASGLVRDDVSFQVEFGDDPRFPHPYIYQVRAFVRKAVANFKIPNDKGERGLIFGVTPEEGIVLPVMHLRDGSEWNADMESGESWALVKTYHPASPPLSFRPRDMRAYLPSHSFNPTFGRGGPTLEHDNYRLAQKADISVFENIGESHRFTPLILPERAGEITSRDDESRWQEAVDKVKGRRTGAKVRIVSDGVRRIVELAA